MMQCADRTMKSRMLSIPRWSIRQLETTGSSISRTCSTDGWSGWSTALPWRNRKCRMNHINDEELKWPLGFRVFVLCAGLRPTRLTNGAVSLNVTHTHLLLVSWQLGKKGLVMIWGLWPAGSTLLIMPFSTRSSLWLSQVKACSSALRHSSTARANSGTFRLIR